MLVAVTFNWHVEVLLCPSLSVQAKRNRNTPLLSMRVFLEAESSVLRRKPVPEVVCLSSFASLHVSNTTRQILSSCQEPCGGWLPRLCTARRRQQQQPCTRCAAASQQLCLPWAPSKPVLEGFDSSVCMACRLPGCGLRTVQRPTTLPPACCPVLSCRRPSAAPPQLFKQRPPAAQQPPSRQANSPSS